MTELRYRGDPPLSVPAGGHTKDACQIWFVYVHVDDVVFRLS